MSWLDSFLHPEKGYDKAQEELQKYFQQAQQMQQPYNQQGLAQAGNLNEYIKSLMNPEALQAKWASGYAESPEAKMAEQMAAERGMNAASSMGLMGSSPALGAIQQGTSEIGIADRQKYLDDLMQKYLAGAGLSQGMYGTGAGAAGQMGQNAMNMGQNSAGLAFGKQNAPGNILSNLIGTIGGVAGSALGGPIGGGLAKKWGLT
jgi:hypothetical protein